MRTRLVLAIASLILLATGVASAQAPAPSTKGAKGTPAKQGAAKAGSAKRDPGRPGVPTSGPPMVVQVVRSAEPGCEPICTEWIAAQGRIDANTPRQFKKALAQIGSRKLPILVDSAGGTVDEALAIGRMIRARGLDVAVTKTEMATCTPADAACKAAKARGAVPGRAKSHASRCASSCAFLLAAGKRRFVGPGTFAGVHQLTTFETQVKVLRTYRIETRREWGMPVAVRKTLVSEKRLAEKTTMAPTSNSMYERVRRYFAEMGIGEGVMSALIATPATSIHWFSTTDLQNTRLATDLVSGEKLLAGLDTAAPTIPSVTPPGGASQSLSPAEDALKKDAAKLKAECGSAGGILIACPMGPVGVGEVAR